MSTHTHEDLANEIADAAMSGITRFLEPRGPVPPIEDFEAALTSHDDLPLFHRLFGSRSAHMERAIGEALHGADMVIRNRVKLPKAVDEKFQRRLEKADEANISEVAAERQALINKERQVAVDLVVDEIAKRMRDKWQSVVDRQAEKAREAEKAEVQRKKIAAKLVGQVATIQSSVAEFVRLSQRARGPEFLRNYIEAAEALDIELRRAVQ